MAVNQVGPTKWLLDYSLSVQTTVDPSNYLIINPPMTLEFDIKRDDFNSANSATFRIFNLSQNTRSPIRIDQWDLQNQRNIILRAGYNPSYGPNNLRGISQTNTTYSNFNLPIIFFGIIQRAYSKREGNAFVTTIEALDSGLMVQSPDFSRNYSSGGSYTNQAIVGDIVKYLSQYGVSAGAVGDFPGSPARGASYSGRATDILNQLTSGNYFVDLNKLNCLGDDECLASEDIQVINSESGLMNTPSLEQNRIVLDMIFSPEFHVAQKVKVESLTAADAVLLGQAYINQFCRIKSVSHKGTISDAMSGEATTHLILQPGTFKDVSSGG